MFACRYILVLGICRGRRMSSKMGPLRQAAWTFGCVPRHRYCHIVRFATRVRRVVGAQGAMFCAICTWLLSVAASFARFAVITSSRDSSTFGEWQTVVGMITLVRHDDRGGGVIGCKSVSAEAAGNEGSCGEDSMTEPRWAAGATSKLRRWALKFGNHCSTVDMSRNISPGP